MRHPLDEIAYKALSVVRNRAERDGLDFLEELNKVGLIATKPRIQEIRISALRDLHDRLEMMSSVEMLHLIRGNSNGGTAADMYGGILRWIREYVETYEK